MRRRILVVVVIVGLAVLGLFAQTRNSTTLAQAQAKEAEARARRARYSGYGILCGPVTYACENLYTRAVKKPELASALLQAKAADVFVWPYPLPWFSVGIVGAGIVDVFIWYSDESIIAFLAK